ncbi:hypothetical protein OIE73_21090 [Streptomyces hirsutus]|uniref:DUF768 domain-containing protein n=1 Tax=Streptomyces hirsutus TaxID=35620 RepID=A0ABZ1GPX9_9ACTN|nr:hypothetical protein [Streptomyces hirsutus]WSD07985.1 hypothetical protein OIE73_21090 [Streptomyces hirsutus]
MKDSETFRSAVRARATGIVESSVPPYDLAMEILGLASGGLPVDPDEEADVGHVGIWGELTDWVELRPAEADQAEAHMIAAAHEWLTVEGDREAEAHYFDRWLHDILGFERRTRLRARKRP